MTMNKNAALAFAVGSVVAVTLAVQAVAHSEPAVRASADVGVAAHGWDGGVSALAVPATPNGADPSTAPAAAAWDASPMTTAYDGGTPSATAYDASPVTMAWDGSRSMP